MGLFHRAGKGVTAAKRARQRGRLQSCVFVLGVFFLPGLVILGGVVSAIYGWFVQRELDALEASIRAKGEPVTREELDAYLKRTLESNHKAQEYLRPLELLAVLPEEDRATRFTPSSIEDIVGKGAIPEDQLIQACAYLELRLHVLDALKDAESTSQTLEVNGDWDIVSYRLLNQFEKCIWTKGLMALHDLDWESFFGAQEQLLNFAEAFAESEYPTPAVRHAMDLLKRAIITGEVPAEFYERISASYRRIDRQGSLRWWMVRHRAGVSEALRSYYGGQEVDASFVAYVPLRTWFYRRLRNVPGYRSLATHDILWQTRYFTAVLDDHEKAWHVRYANMIARQPFVEGFDMAGDRGMPWHNRKLNGIARILYPQVDDSWWERRSIGEDGSLVRTPLTLSDAFELFCFPEKHVQGHWLGHPLFDMDDPTEDFIEFEFRLRSVRLAMLIDAYRQQMGAFPESLDALDPVAVAAIGGDPYVDGPLGYRVVEGGFLVYSVGPNLKDDGAEATEEGYYLDLIERFEKEKSVVVAEEPKQRGRETGGLTRPRAR